MIDVGTRDGKSKLLNITLVCILPMQRSWFKRVPIGQSEWVDDKNAIKQWCGSKIHKVHKQNVCRKHRTGVTNLLRGMTQHIGHHHDPGPMWLNPQILHHTHNPGGQHCLQGTQPLLLHYFAIFCESDLCRVGRHLHSNYCTIVSKSNLHTLQKTDCCSRK